MKPYIASSKKCVFHHKTSYLSSSFLDNTEKWRLDEVNLTALTPGSLIEIWQAGKKKKISLHPILQAE